RSSPNGKVAAEIAKRRTDAAVKADLTVASHLEELCRLRDLAKASKQYGAAIQAEIKRGEAAGFYIKRGENIKYQKTREYQIADVPRTAGGAGVGVVADYAGIASCDAHL